MPKTKFQGAVFGLLMSYIMAFGMEVYNTAINMVFLTSSGSFSSMTNMVFWNAFKETLYMGAIVFVLSGLFGNKIGEKFANKYCDPQKDNPYFCLLFLLFISVWIALMIAPKHFLHRFESSLYKTAAWHSRWKVSLKIRIFIYIENR